MEDRKISLEELTKKLSEHDLDKHPLVQKALAQAEESHKDMIRDEGSGYLEHHIYPVTFGVMEYYQKTGKKITPELIAASLLHDSLEDDSLLTEDFFVREFGNEVFQIVKPLSKGDYRDYLGKDKREKKHALNKEYILGLESAPIEAIHIKLEDRCNNISSIHHSPKEGKVEYYIEETELFYIPLAEKHSASHYKRLKELVEIQKNRK